MKLTELNPAWDSDEHSATTLTLDCPTCKTHRITVPFSASAVNWHKTGFGFNDMTLRPSILHKSYYADGMDKDPRFCETHFFITEGEISMA